jgi:hypothetical protein
MELKTGIFRVKKLIKDNKLENKIAKFLDVTSLDGNFYIICSLIINHKIKFIFSQKDSDIYINLFDKSRILISSNNRENEVTKLVCDCIGEIESNLSDSDYYLKIFQLMLDVLKFYETNKETIELFIMDSLSIKNDLQQIAYKLDGLYKTGEYKKLLAKYYDVI